MLVRTPKIEMNSVTKLNWIKEHEEVFYDVAFISKILNHIQQSQIDDIIQLFFLLFVSGVVYIILVDLGGYSTNTGVFN